MTVKYRIIFQYSLPKKEPRWLIQREYGDYWVGRVHTYTWHEAVAILRSWGW